MSSPSNNNTDRNVSYHDHDFFPVEPGNVVTYSSADKAFLLKLEKALDANPELSLRVRLRLQHEMQWKPSIQVLTVREPHASFIAAGFKKVENRSISLLKKQCALILLHHGKKIDYTAAGGAVLTPQKYYESEYGKKILSLPQYKDQNLSVEEAAKRLEAVEMDWITDALLIVNQPREGVQYPYYDQPKPTPFHLYIHSKWKLHLPLKGHRGQQSLSGVNGKDKDITPVLQALASCLLPVCLCALFSLGYIH